MLRVLDGLLDRLEWVNERGLDELPDTLVASLRAQGFACTQASSATALIQSVWERQTRYLKVLSVKRRRGSLDFRQDVFLANLHRPLSGG
jgi:hypothetical protein